MFNKKSSLIMDGADLTSLKDKRESKKLEIPAVFGAGS